MSRSSHPKSADLKSADPVPKKWLLVIVVALIAYTLLQPVIQQRLGWNLPSLSSEKHEAEKREPPKAPPPPTAKNQTSKLDEPQLQDSSDRNPTTAVTAGQRGDNRGDQATVPKPAGTVTAPEKKNTSQKNTSHRNSDQNAPGNGIAEKNASDKNDNSPDPRLNGKTSAAEKPPSSSEGDLVYGRLREVSPKRYISPAGLQYLPGSEEGHRLQHLQRHLEDMPDRPGKHGVFEGDMPQVLDWIDEAYTRGQRGGRGIRKMEEDGRTIYEVPFDKPIGYVGGRDGGHSFNPAAKRLRLVVDGNKFITAFPY